MLLVEPNGCPNAKIIFTSGTIIVGIDMEESNSRIRDSKFTFQTILYKLLKDPKLSTESILKTYVDNKSIEKFEDLIKKA